MHDLWYGAFFLYEEVLKSYWLLIEELKLVVQGLILLFMGFISSLSFFNSFLTVVCSKIYCHLFESPHCRIQILEHHKMVWAPKMEVFNSCLCHSSDSGVLKLFFVFSNARTVKCYFVKAIVVPEGKCIPLLCNMWEIVQNKVPLRHEARTAKVNVHSFWMLVAC